MAKDAIEQLGPRIRELRLQAGLTQEQLANLTGKSPEAISNLERGKAVPSVATLSLLAGKLGVSLEHMFKFDVAAKGNAAEGLEGKLSLLNKGDRDLVSDFVDLLLRRRRKK